MSKNQLVWVPLSELASLGLRISVPPPKTLDEIEAAEMCLLASGADEEDAYTVILRESDSSDEDDREGDEEAVLRDELWAKGIDLTDVDDPYQNR